MQIVVIGDSLVHGSTVSPDRNLPGHLRRYFPDTLALGNGGSGPLLELATLEEYAADLKPPVVLWCFFQNDIEDVVHELTYPALTPYLENGYTQNLRSRQPEIDRVLTDLVDQESKIARANSWPSWLTTAGLRRAHLPVWMQDLVTGGAHTRTAMTIRFDGLTSWVSSASRRLRGRSKENVREVDPYQAIRRILGRVRDLTRVWNSKLYVVSLPPSVLSRGAHVKYPVKEYGTVHQIVRDLGLPLIDVTPEYARHSDVPSLYYYPYSHPNELGYAEIARIVAAKLSAAGVRSANPPSFAATVVPRAQRTSGGAKIGASCIPP